LSPLPSIVVLGTDTGVGKTVVTGLLTRAYHRMGCRAAPFKPVATGAVYENGSPVWADTAWLSLASGVRERDIGQYRFAKPLSPHLAPAGDETPAQIGPIVDKYRRLKARFDAVIVEGVGGLMVPLNDRDWLIDLLEALALDIVVVARPGLGTINHTVLTVNALEERGLNVAGLVINRVPDQPDEAQATNPAELERLTRVPVLGLVPELDLSVEGLRTGRLDPHLGRLDLSKLESTGPASHGEAIEADRRHVWHPFSPMLEYLEEQPPAPMIVKAKGCRLEDSEGRVYLDGISSLWVNVHGHRHAALDQAIKRQLAKVAHTTLLGLGNEPSALLAQRLAEMTPDGLSRVFYSDSGSTAVEAALKVAFQYYRQTGRPRKQKFVSFINAYHGDTLGAVSVGGHSLFHSIFKPLLFESRLVPAAYCFRCPVNDSYPGCDHGCLKEFAELLAADHEAIAAVVVEPKVQGAGGILIQPPGYLTKIAQLCRRFDVLLIADEVATGFGRTGRMFACDHEETKPDIMALAKGITGGYLPLAATVVREEIYEAFLGRYEELKTFFHGHTYTGNPLACAAALANLELLDEPGFEPGLVKKAELLASLLRPLEELDIVGEARQCGLMIGIELVADKKSRRPFAIEERIGRRVTLKARERGVIIRPLGDIIVLMPPPAMTEAELKELVEVTGWAIHSTYVGELSSPT
jgi:adenosylmethionine---8-amino-7-oxononanoate aminotransferase